MATWPSELPAPLLDGYGVNPSALTVRTEMSSGLPRVRRKSVGKLIQVAFGLKFSKTQMATFETWFYSSTGANAGAAWFELLLNLPEGTVTKMCRFVQPYQASLLKTDIWQVTATIEVQDA